MTCGSAEAGVLPKSERDGDGLTVYPKSRAGARPTEVKQTDWAPEAVTRDALVI